jgi:uncharacterized protein YjiS (DUF1127 family)
MTRFFHAIPAWIARARRTVSDRRTLALMDERMLADIGVGQAEAKAEAARRFWDLD